MHASVARKLVRFLNPRSTPELAERRCPSKAFALAALAVVVLAPAGLGQQPACEPYESTIPPCNHVFGPPVPVPETPTPVIKSRCWYTVCASVDDPAILGFPLNLGMGFGLAMGDYPPLTLDARASTAPVVGREGSYHARAVPAATRPTLNGVVDLITGVSLLQETVTDPLVVDGDNEPIKVEDEADLPPLTTVTLTTREYIHSPGYVDEVVAEVDVPLSGTTAPDRPAWVIQDANYNLVALVDDAGVMLHQYTWDPYGQPIAIDRYDTGVNGSPQPFENRIGHQGLFLDRFDGGAQNVLLQQIAVHPATGLS
jgi:YD repeat-containing protein